MQELRDHFLESGETMCQSEQNDDRTVRWRVEPITISCRTSSRISYVAVITSGASVSYVHTIPIISSPNRANNRDARASDLGSVVREISASVVWIVTCISAADPDERRFVNGVCSDCGAIRRRTSGKEAVLCLVQQTVYSCPSQQSR
jgi:hypothetical protein